MAYSTDLLDKRVEVWNRTPGNIGDLGASSGEWVLSFCVWANVYWSKGVRSLREGALDAYDTVMIRMRYVEGVDRDSRFACDGKVYEIDSLHAVKRENTIQAVCHEVQL